MFKKIYVPVDNSDYSNAAIDTAIALGKQCGSELIGCHVFAATMHDYRFKQMEFTLPEEYQDDEELEKQRKIHDSLITMGLQLISDSYLDVMERRCAEENLPFERRTFDGRTFEPLVKDIKESDYDLVIIGALGLGAVKDSTLGSVTQRVVRRTATDTWVIKDPRPLAEQNGGPIVVGIDGSPQSFGGLKEAIALAKTFDRPLEAVAVYDPYLHYAMFNSIVHVLSEQASRVFRFKEQEQLHEEVIDTGLAKIYQSHLEVAKTVAADEGVDLKITLLDGKAFEKVIQYVRKVEPWLLILGRIGVHSDETMDIGANSENLLRLAPCHVLLVSKKFYPPLDIKAEEAISWTEEAEERMRRVPQMVRGVARTAVLRYATERGHSVITSKVIDETIDFFMPEHTATKMTKVAHDLAMERAKQEETASYICTCGYVAKKAEPIKCPLCGAPGSEFVVIDRRVVEAIASQEGGVEEHQAFDGVKLKWSKEALDLLRAVEAGYVRRRTKARIEKAARVQKLSPITREFAAAIILDTVGEIEGLDLGTSLRPQNGGDGRRLWTEEAVVRLNKVPAGFMRRMARDKIEAMAESRGADRVTLEIAEEGVAEARKMMEEIIANYGDRRGS